MSKRSMRTLSLLGMGLALGLTFLAGCAPEEEGTPVVGRPKTATPTPVVTQKSDQQLKGGIKDASTAAGTPTNPPQPEPTPLPTWQPSAPPSLDPIIVVATEAPTEEATPEPTPVPDVDPGND